MQCLEGFSLVFGEGVSYAGTETSMTGNGGSTKALDSRAWYKQLRSDWFLQVALCLSSGARERNG